MTLLGVSVVTCGVLYGLLAAILAVVFYYLNIEIWISFATVIVIIVIQFIVSPWITDLMQKWFYKTNFEWEPPTYLKTFITETCEAHGVKYPKLGFISDGAPNAFTYGRTKRDARIVLTKGLFDLCDEEEVKAVVAHELGHVVHYDMAVITMVQVVPMVLYMVADVLLKIYNNAGSNNNSRRFLLTISFIAYIFYLICQYIILMLSRVREYYADEFSGEVTHNPSALSSALVNIGFGLSTRKKSAEAKGSVSNQSVLGIFDVKQSKTLIVSCFNDGEIDKDRIKGAMKWELWNTWAFWYEIGSTHPLTSKRIIRLEKQAEAMGLEPFVNFDLVKPESYVDDFVRELAICILPTVGAVVTGVLLFLFAEVQSSNTFMTLVGGGFLTVGMLLSIVKYMYTHPRNGYFEANTAGLLSEVKVSMVRSIPAELKGVIIGRGDPGCIFDENFVLRDDTGILFLDYNQPLWIINKVFALFKAHKYIDKTVTVKGWYRRNMVPFLELYSMEIDGEVRKCYSYGFGWAWRIALLVVGLVMLAMSFGLL